MNSCNRKRVRCEQNSASLCAEVTGHFKGRVTEQRAGSRGGRDLNRVKKVEIYKKWEAGQLIGLSHLGLLISTYLEEKQISVFLWQEVLMWKVRLLPSHSVQELELPPWVFGFQRDSSPFLKEIVLVLGMHISQKGRERIYNCNIFQETVLRGCLGT